MKSILVLDTPYSCADCRFCEYIDSVKSSVCTADPLHMFKMNEEGGVYTMRRDFSCPLKSLPQKKEPMDAIQYNGLAEEYRKEGWNECLLEMLKGK